jgi:hypothetical protein
MPAQIEQRVLAALSANGSQSSADLAEMLGELETAIADAKELAELEREKSLDPSVRPDAKKARQDAEDAQFRVGRLLTLMPRLQRKYAALFGSEQKAQAREKAKPLIEERNRLADELEAALPCLEKLADIFTRIAANSVAINRFRVSLPPEISFHIRDAELEARGLEAFTREFPSILKGTVLLGVDGKSLWPPRRLPDPSFFEPVPHNRRFSGDWGVQMEEQQRQREEAEIAAAKQAEAKAAEMAKELNMPEWWRK